MPTFKLPLSGDVVQSINPFTAFMTGGQFGLININLGQSSEPKVEEEVLSDVATYGKQLGRIGDAMIVLLAHFHPRQAADRGRDRGDRRAQDDAGQDRRREREIQKAGDPTGRRRADLLEPAKVGGAQTVCQNTRHWRETCAVPPAILTFMA